MLVGGKRHGAIVEATVLENVPSDCHVACDEVFGPVMILDRYATFKDAVVKSVPKPPSPCSCPILSHPVASFIKGPQGKNFGCYHQESSIEHHLPTDVQGRSGPIAFGKSLITLWELQASLG